MQRVVHTVYKDSDQMSGVSMIHRWACMSDEGAQRHWFRLIAEVTVDCYQSAALFLNYCTKNNMTSTSNFNVLYVKLLPALHPQTPCVPWRRADRGLRSACGTYEGWTGSQSIITV